MKVRVDYYNKKEEELLQKYNNSEEIESIAGSEIDISKDELLSGMMFTEQLDKEGFRTYQDLRIKHQKRLGDIDDYIDMSDGTIKAKSTSEHLNAAGITERIGVAAGLSTINRIHGLSEADWSRTLPEYDNGVRKRDIDYNIDLAASEKGFVQSECKGEINNIDRVHAENKGSVVEDNKYKTSSVSNHYRSIKEKKSDIREKARNKGNDIENELMYGTITVIDSKHTAQVWLVDPPAFQVNWDPLKYKLISRLSYYLTAFKEISVHNKIVQALEKRIQVLIEVDDIQNFNRKRLDGIANNYRSRVKRDYFLSIENDLVLGTWFLIKPKDSWELFVHGFTNEIITLVINQDFDKILSYQFNRAEFQDNVTVFVSTKFTVGTDNMEIIEFAKNFALNERNGRFEFQVYTPLLHLTTGRVFGRIALKSE